uniref:Uncharacterized protein n=1 Tax=Physcomitrium patens TaxID=3218 RepID=A0A2K1IB67_PHYPA|nr:hypothetical protein PHYPA_030012 [Physcomitrium patens]PNR32520.1 hypothetical protein PHYPA_024462 [Physcomitrium patens]PNR32522.1 hypothetical protein PHYPA_024464 [Physcomitrium patens]PNR32527.1 hypothetical protein PHYPA_024469 [Physcomitrium patens]PNR32529.1 hypothetical protein PHYPA_024471 [Physcomitrium patens]
MLGERYRPYNTSSVPSNGFSWLGSLGVRRGPQRTDSTIQSAPSSFSGKQTRRSKGCVLCFNVCCRSRRDPWKGGVRHFLQGTGKLVARRSPSNRRGLLWR